VIPGTTQTQHPISTGVPDRPGRWVWFDEVTIPVVIEACERYGIPCVVDAGDTAGRPDVEWSGVCDCGESGSECPVHGDDTFTDTDGTVYGGPELPERPASFAGCPDGISGPCSNHSHTKHGSLDV
jgi:hypothetical protein